VRPCRLPTADLAWRIGVGGGVSAEALKALYRGPGVLSRRAEGGEVASATSPSTRKKPRWPRGRPPLINCLRLFRPHLVPARLLFATGLCVPDPRGPEPTNMPPAGRRRYFRGARRGPELHLRSRLIYRKAHRPM
jgi:hypothetical protein